MATVSNTTKTLADIRKMVYFMLSESANSTIFSTENVTSAINLALSDIGRTANRAKKRITTTTVIGQREYPIPDAILQLGRALVSTVSIVGTEIPAELYSEDTGTNGTPTGFYVRGNSIGLNPTPNATVALSLLYSYEFGGLVNDTDTTELSDVFINAAVLYTCYLLKLKDEEFSSADRFLEAYDRAMKRASQIQSGTYRGTSAVTYGGVV